MIGRGILMALAFAFAVFAWNAAVANNQAQLILAVGLALAFWWSASRYRRRP